jgi:hypothetical protein
MAQIMDNVHRGHCPVHVSKVPSGFDEHASRRAASKYFGSRVTRYNLAEKPDMNARFRVEAQIRHRLEVLVNQAGKQASGSRRPAPTGNSRLDAGDH